MRKLSDGFIYFIFLKLVTLIVVSYLLSKHPDRSIISSYFTTDGIKKSIVQNLTFISERETSRIFKERPLVQECDCQAIFNGNRHEIKRVRRINESKGLSQHDYAKETKNCSDFLLKRGYIMDSLSENERQFPIAYSILIYTAVEQSEHLLRAIYRPQNIYCIHVDIKTSDYIYKAVESIANCFDNVFMSSKRFDVRWGTMTVLEPDLQCMADLSTKRVAWKYFINLTGQEFPLKSNFELVEILKAFNGANDVDINRHSRYKKRWVKGGNPPHGIIPTKGNMHITASRAFVEFILTDPRAKDLLDWGRKIWIPDEVFFSSLLYNPSLKAPGSYKDFRKLSAVNDTENPYLSRFINWLGEGEDIPCHGKWVRDVCVFGVGDLPLLKNRKELFVNKLYYDFEPLAFDCLEELIFNRTREIYMGQTVVNIEWYRELGFVKDHV